MRVQSLFAKERDEERRGVKNRGKERERKGGRDREKGEERERERKRGEKKEREKEGRRECPMRFYFFRLLRVGSRVNSETQGPRKHSRNDPVRA